MAKAHGSTEWHLYLKSMKFDEVSLCQAKTPQTLDTNLPDWFFPPLGYVFYTRQSAQSEVTITICVTPHTLLAQRVSRHLLFKSPPNLGHFRILLPPFLLGKLPYHLPFYKIRHSISLILV